MVYRQIVKLIEGYAFFIHGDITIATKSCHGSEKNGRESSSSDIAHKGNIAHIGTIFSPNIFSLIHLFNFLLSTY